ncbi:MBL fold metallo-hydrolase [Nakamurella flava]|nr:MBL fold metallo-hydrolase [Nakamurella flava]
MPSTPRALSTVVSTVTKVSAATAALAALTSLGRATRGLPEAMGADADALAAAGRRSPHFADGVFHNTLPSSVVDAKGGLALVPEAIKARGRGRPDGRVPLVTTRPPAQAADCAITWLGHATTLLEIDGAFVLADPVWGNRVSPSPTVGPLRLHPMPVVVEDLPRLTAIVISHDHYDHLDLPTVRALLRWQTAPFLVPVGIGAHLRHWGVPEDRIVELDWEESHHVGDLTLTCTESRHFSGRGLTRNTTLWCSWAIAGPRHRMFFGGDTGYTPAFTGIGERHGPFDVTVLPIGAYGDQWPDIHLNPEEAAQANRDLGGGLFVPIHWASFNLAFHGWAEPVERLLTAGPDLDIVVPRPGQRIEPGGDVPHPADDPWWRTLPPAPIR